MATSKIMTKEHVFTRKSTSVFDYAKSIPNDGIYFYSTTAGTTDNPANGSCMFIINKGGGISILAMMTGSRNMYYTAAPNAVDFDPWKAVTMS